MSDILEDARAYALAGGGVTAVNAGDGSMTLHLEPRE